MQVLVTRRKNRKFSKMRIKSVVRTILIFLFAIVSSAILITIKKKSLMYEERIFYLVSATSEHRESLLDPKKELLKNLGAANVVYKQGDKCHLIVGVYFDSESAEEIKGNLLKYFSEAQVIKVKSKKITRSSIKHIKASLECEKFIKKLYSLTGDFQSLQMDYLSGKCTNSQFIESLVNAKLELGKIIEQIQSKDEYHEKIKERGNLMLSKMTNFLTGLDVSRSRQNYICNYFVSFYIDFLEFYESL